MPRFLAAVWAFAGLPAAWEGSHTIQPVEPSPMAIAFLQQQRAHPRPEISRPFWLSPAGIEGWPLTTVIQQSVH